MDFNSEKIDALEIVESDKGTIFLGNIFTVDADLVLPIKGKRGSAILWETEDAEIITTLGKVTRPKEGEGNRLVRLTATIAFGEVAMKRVFDVNVVEQERKYNVIKVWDTDLTIAEEQSPERILTQLPLVVVVTKENNTFGTEKVRWEKPLVDTIVLGKSFQIVGQVTNTLLLAIANINILEETHHNTSHKCGGHGNITAGQKMLTPFRLNEVSLADREFSENRNRGEAYLLGKDDDQMLYSFREVAGLDKKGAKPMEGWDAPECNLKGHTLGHYLSALAQASKSSENPRFKEKLEYLVSELRKCQLALNETGKYSGGFLSAYSEEQFILLEEFTEYPKIWAPYYTLHKIMAGLLDCYEIAGIEEALPICEELGDWIYCRLCGITREQRNKMWELYIAGEFGGMNEVMARLFCITGKSENLITAKYFDNEKLYLPMEKNIDTLDGMHANQHIPQILGALRMYEESKEERYYKIAETFWDKVVMHHTYNIGGVGSGEMFKGADKIARFITDKTAETCATYNMLKLSRNLFFHKPEGKYMDYYERALYNHILASQEQSGPTGGSTYFMPLYPGRKKNFHEDINSCCHGTGMENHTKYQDSIYFKSFEEDQLYVNLYIPSELTWKGNSLKVRQKGDFLRNQGISITFEGSGEVQLKLWLRVPYWVEKDFEVSINGEKQLLLVTKGSYTSIERKWKNGDEVQISMPFSFRIERTPDDKTIGSIFYGPLVMVGKSDFDGYIELNLNEGNIEKVIEASGEPLVFSIKDLTLVPNYMINQEPYHAYFKIKE